MTTVKPVSSSDGPYQSRDWLGLSQPTMVREIIVAIAVMGIVYPLRKVGLDTGILAIPFALIFWFYRRPLLQARTVIVVIVGASSIGAALYCATLALLVLISTLSGNKTRPAIRRHNILIVLFIGMAIASWLLNQLVAVNVLSLPLWGLSFLSPIGIYFYFQKWSLDEVQIRQFVFFLIAVAITQCTIAWGDYISHVGFKNIWVHAVTPDFVLGTFRSANDFGLFLLQVATLCFALLISSKLLAKSSVKAMLLLLFSFLFIYTSDSKTQLYAFIISWTVILIIFWKWRLSDTSSKWLFMGVIGAIVIAPSAIMQFMSKYDAVYVDYLDGDKAMKTQFIKSAIDVGNRPLFHWLAGYGPGTCGSRASNMRAYDTLPKSDESQANKVKSFLPAYSSDCTRDFLAPLYTWEYAEGSKYRSALLGNPFNSWTAIWFELGLIGSILWAALMATFLARARKVYHQTQGFHRYLAVLAGANVIAVSIVAVITQGFEDPVAMMLSWFFIAQLYKPLSTLISKS